MIDLLLGAILVGKVEVSPNTFQLDYLTKDEKIVRVIETQEGDLGDIAYTYTTH